MDATRLRDFGPKRKRRCMRCVLLRAREGDDALCPDCEAKRAEAAEREDYARQGIVEATACGWCGRSIESHREPPFPVPRYRSGLQLVRGADALERVLSNREWRGAEIERRSDGGVILRHPSGARLELYPHAFTTGPINGSEKKRRR